MTKTEAGRRVACAPEAAQKEGFFGLIGISGCRDFVLAAVFSFRLALRFSLAVKYLREYPILEM